MLDAHDLRPVPITTPAYSPGSNGLAEAFVVVFAVIAPRYSRYGIRQSVAADRMPRRAAIVMRAGRESAFIYRITWLR